MEEGRTGRNRRGGMGRMERREGGGGRKRREAKGGGGKRRKRRKGGKEERRKGGGWIRARWLTNITQPWPRKVFQPVLYNTRYSWWHTNNLP